MWKNTLPYLVTKSPSVQWSVIRGSCAMFWLLNLGYHEQKLLGQTLALQPTNNSVKWLALSSSPIFILNVLLCDISNKFGKCCIRNFPLGHHPLKLLDIWGCIACFMTLPKWHSSIHRKDEGILRIHEIIFSTVDQKKLLARVRLRTPIQCPMWFPFRSSILIRSYFCFHCCFVAICFAVWTWTEHSWGSCFLNNRWLLFGCICCWWLGNRGKHKKLFQHILGACFCSDFWNLRRHVLLFMKKERDFEL